MHEYLARSHRILQHTPETLFCTPVLAGSCHNFQASSCCSIHGFAPARSHCTNSSFMTLTRLQGLIFTFYSQYNVSPCSTSLTRYIFHHIPIINTSLYLGPEYCLTLAYLSVNIFTQCLHCPSHPTPISLPCAILCFKNDTSLFLLLS